MTVLHPWAIVLGLSAVLLPILIHWLTRPRPVRLPLSTIRFVRQAVRDRRSRHRLRDWLTLALRTLAVGLLAWAIARPLTDRQPLVAPGAEGSAVRVVVLDVSQSMAARVHGIQLLERCRSLAAGYLEDRPALQANLVLAGATARPVFDRLSSNFGALREELGQAQPRPERLNAQAAINLAAELLGRSDRPGRRELVILSDFQRSNWAAVDFSPLSADVKIQFDSVAPAEALPNLAVLRAGTRGLAEPGREVRLEVEVGNFSTTARQVQLEVVLGEATYRLTGTCPAGDKTTLATEVLLRGTGWRAGVARLLDTQDALPEDDSRPFVVEVRSAPTIALLTRQLASVRPSSSYYLERALAPAGGTGRLTRLAPDRLDAEALAGIDAIVVDHPGQLTSASAKLLTAALRRGRAVLYVAAEPVDAANLKLFVETAGSDLQLPVEFLPPPTGRPRRDLFLAEARRDQAPFTALGDGFAALTGPLRFAGGLASRRLDGTSGDDVLATYNDRSACLVVGSCGSGQLAVLNADLAASNLPASPAFVPLVSELLARLVVQASRLPFEAAPGEPLAVYLPPAAGPAAGLKLVDPAGKGENTGQLIEESSGVLWRSPAAGVPGVYQVQRGADTVHAVACAIPPEESDLRGLDPAVLQDRLAGGHKVRYRTLAGTSEHRDDWWVWLAVGCLACLLGEVGVLKLFRS